MYFQAYRHNLIVLQSFNENNFPMKKYIVSVEKTISLPKYLSVNDVFSIENISQTKKFQFNVSCDGRWPSYDKLEMNQSQYDAFKFALMNELAIIQGPPGTGKFFLALKIVETLLVNTKLTILIVCYTNHALDKFVDDIRKFYPNVIRIGGKNGSKLKKAYQSRIIGITTTSAAKNRKLINDLSPEITSKC